MTTNWIVGKWNFICEILKICLPWFCATLYILSLSVSLTSPLRRISGILKESPLVTRVNVPSFWLRTAPPLSAAPAAEGSVMQQEARPLNGASVEREREKR